MQSTRSDDTALLKEAAAEDCNLLVSLMAEFYAESGYQLDRERARARSLIALSQGRIRRQ